MIWLLQDRGQLGHSSILLHLLDHLDLSLGPLQIELGVLAGKVARKLLSLGSCVAAQVTLPAFRLEM